MGLALSAFGRVSQPARRTEARLALVGAVGYGFFVSGFVDWPAGDAAGPRHLLPIVGLLGVGLVHALEHLQRLGQQRPASFAVARGLVGSLVLIGVLANAPSVITWPYHFAALPSPLTQIAWPFALDVVLSPTLGRLAGMPEPIVLGLFAALTALPFALLPTLPPLADAAEVPSRREAAARRMLAFCFCVLLGFAWVYGAVHNTGRTGSRVLSDRYRAWHLLGVDPVRNPHLYEPGHPLAPRQPPRMTTGQP
jgi:hypothetical protein